MVPTGWEIGMTKSITDLVHEQHAGEKKTKDVKWEKKSRCQEQETAAPAQIV